MQGAMSNPNIALSELLLQGTPNDRVRCSGPLKLALLFISLSFAVFLHSVYFISNRSGSADDSPVINMASQFTLHTKAMHPMLMAKVRHLAQEAKISQFMQPKSALQPRQHSRMHCARAMGGPVVQTTAEAVKIEEVGIITRCNVNLTSITNENFGFCWVEPCNGGDEIWFHVHNIMDGAAVSKGDQVVYTRELDDWCEKYHCVNVRKASGDISHLLAAPPFKQVVESPASPVEENTIAPEQAVEPVAAASGGRGGGGRGRGGGGRGRGGGTPAVAKETAAPKEVAEPVAPPVIQKEEVPVKEDVVATQEGTATAKPLVVQVDAIKKQLGLDDGLAIVPAVQQANAAMGLASTGTLMDQVAALNAALGL